MHDPLTERVRSEPAELDDIRLLHVAVSHLDGLPQIQSLGWRPWWDANRAGIERAGAIGDTLSKVAIPQAS